MSITERASLPRRAILASGFGGLAAFAAGALGRPARVNATDGAALVIGDDTQTASSTTSLSTSSPTAVGLMVKHANTGHGLWGESVDGYGVYANSTNNAGLFAYSTYRAVEGFAGSAGAGVVGQSPSGGTGVIGSTTYAPNAKALTGVYGNAPEAGGRGVWGYAVAGQGVRGEATTGIGVRGFATSGPAGSFKSTSGYAIQASGRLSFGKASGTATIASGTKSVLVTPGTDVATGTFVLATLQGSAGGTTTVHRVATDPTNNRFTIYLTANATASVKVAWLVMG